MLRVVLGFLCCTFIYPLYRMLGLGTLDWSLVAYLGAVCVLLGVPFLIYVNPEQRPTFWETVSAGGCIGIICALPLVLATGPFVVVFVAYFLPMGMAHGVVFWLVAVWRNRALPIRAIGKRARQES